MDTEPRIVRIEQKIIIGKRLKMSLANNRTGELWGSFMPRRKEIGNTLNSNLISMQVYSEPLTLGRFDQTFEKWAGVEVSDFNTIPEGMESFMLEEGLYAVFDYKGSSTDHSIFAYIFGTWIPKSDYNLDNRPHFEILGAKYKNADPNSEEEIWIPIKPKNKP